jgi:arylsulfatase A-like enzyme
MPLDKDNSARFIATLEKARKRGESGIFWMHMVEPHRGYKPHAKFDFGNSEAARYYGEVAFDDASVGRVLEYLRHSSYYEDSLIIIFSDHGEALGEKAGYYGHGVSLAARFGDVPLYVRYPGVQPRVSSAAVSLTSIARTIYHYLDMPIPAGVSACSLLSSESELARCPNPITIVYGIGAETFSHIWRHPIRTLRGLDTRQADLYKWKRYAPELAAVSGTHRYLRNLDNGVEHLYDRQTDPGEDHDLITERPDLLEAFRKQVIAYRKAEAKRLVCQLEPSK